MRALFRGLVCLALFPLLTAIAPGAPAEKRVLVYTKNGKGYVHDNIAAATAALKKLGEENLFLVDVSDDPAVFTESNLKRYKAVIFNNTNNEIFDSEAQRAAFQHYIRAGGGFVGIHSATGSMRQWPWFWSLIGGKFSRHPKMQTFTVVVRDPKDISTAHLPPRFQWTDEFYFVDHMPEGLHFLIAGELAGLDDPEKGKSAGKFKDAFPLAWCHEFEGGRSWYTALGHKPEHYSDPRLVKHLLGGIRWAMGEAK